MLRAQKLGNQKPWTEKEVMSGLKHFFDQNGRYPTAPEVDKYPYLPSARSIERRFGGLVALRKKLRLETQPDFRSGKHSSERAHKINTRAHKTEKTVYEYLKGRFGKEFVHREYFFSDDKRTRADFFVYDTGKGFCVDVFYPSDRRNLAGCLNSKLHKYNNESMGQYPVIFLQMNEKLSQNVLDQLVQNKKSSLNDRQQLMGWGTFQKFCKDRKALRVGKK